MNKIIIGVSCFSLGLLSAKIVDNYNRKQLSLNKEIIDTLFNDEVISMITEIENNYYKQLFFETYCSLIKEGYVTESISEVNNIKYRLDLLLDRIRSYKEENSVSDTLNKDVTEENMNTVTELNSNDVNKNSEIEGDEKDDTFIIQNDIQNEQETSVLNYRHEVLYEELQPPEKSQKVVQVEDNPSSDIEEEATDISDAEFDDDVFSFLLDKFVRPLIEKYGDEYEDRLVEMANVLSSSSINKVVYDEYTTKLKAILHYQTGEKGKRKLDIVISAFFSIVPIDSDNEE